METSKILAADFLDIVFEGKNKLYGAYDLRKNYPKRMRIALASMAFIPLFFVLGQLFAGKGKSEVVKMLVTDVYIDPYKEKIPEIPAPKPVPPQLPPPAVKTIQYATYAIVDDHEVVEAPPEMDALDQARIDVVNRDGVPEDNFVTPPVESKGTGIPVLINQPDEDYEKTFIKVEKEARFPGGLAAWKRFLERNLRSSIATDAGAPVGNYRVKVQFVVDKHGVISNVEAIEVPNACAECGAEAVRVIQRGPDWEPAVQNDRKVAYQAVQIITFQVADE